MGEDLEFLKEQLQRAKADNMDLSFALLVAAETELRELKVQLAAMTKDRDNWRSEAQAGNIEFAVLSAEMKRLKQPSPASVEENVCEAPSS